MHNFFQTQLRKDIKTLVYQEESFSITLFDQEYRWLTKKKNFWPISLSWYQVLGVEIPYQNPQWINEEIKKIQHDFWQSRQDIFFQRGITNELVRVHNVSHRSGQFAPELKHARLALQEQLSIQHDLRPSFRENMPLSTIIIDTTKSDDILLSEMNSGARKHVEKAGKKWIDFCVATPSDYELFYAERLKIAWHKWFNIILYQTFLRLMDYLQANQCGDIFMAKKDGVILWWSIAVYTWDTITYLYGFSNRNREYRNIWVHQFIKFQMFQRAREHNIAYMDLFGWAPTGFPKHPLTSVSAFKESLWGQKIERYGNFDIVFNPLLYKLFEWHHQWKK